MNPLERMARQQKDLQKKFNQLIPDMGHMESIRHNFKLTKRIAKPHKDLIAQLSKVNHFQTSSYRDLIAKLSKVNHFQTSSFSKQIKKLSNTVNKTLPQYSNEFLSSSSVLDSVLTVPDIFKGFKRQNKTLIDSTKQLSSAFEKISINIIKPPILFDTLPDNLIASTMSGSSHFQILKSLSYIDISVEHEIEKEYFDAVSNNCSIAEKKIKSANPEWIVLLTGAEHSLLSRNPDKVRHTITSLRELITQILHQYAPDNELKLKYTDQKYYHQGRPTRKTRIKHILYTKYSNSVLLNIIDKDIAAILEMFDLFQRGTHSVISSLSDEELKFILKRTKLLIEQLI